MKRSGNTQVGYSDIYSLTSRQSCEHGRNRLMYSTASHLLRLYANSKTAIKFSLQDWPRCWYPLSTVVKDSYFHQQHLVQVKPAKFCFGSNVRQSNINSCQWYHSAASLTRTLIATSPAESDCWLTVVENYHDIICEQSKTWSFVHTASLQQHWVSQLEDKPIHQRQTVDQQNTSLWLMTVCSELTGSTDHTQPTVNSQAQLKRSSTQHHTVMYNTEEWRMCHENDINGLIMVEREITWDATQWSILSLCQWNRASTREKSVH